MAPKVFYDALKIGFKKQKKKKKISTKTIGDNMFTVYKWHFTSESLRFIFYLRLHLRSDFKLVWPVVRCLCGPESSHRTLDWVIHQVNTWLSTEHCGRNKLYGYKDMYSFNGFGWETRTPRNFRLFPPRQISVDSCIMDELCSLFSCLDRWEIFASSGSNFLLSNRMGSLFNMIFI